MKTKMRHTLLLIATLYLPCALHAEEWIDVTDSYIVNPRFDNNDVTTGWEGTAFGSASPKENAEHYYKTFDTYQQLSGLKPGKYRLSLNAFYRSGDASNDYSHRNDASEYQLAQMYAITSSDYFSTPLVLACSAALETPLGGSTSTVSDGGNWGGGNWGGGTTYYIPNNMEAAYYWFEAGYYVNYIEEITVEADGEMIIGISKDQTIGSDWVCLDNWKLEYYGNIVGVESLTLSQAKATLQYGETLQLSANILPLEATIQSIIWESTDETVATVDANGLVTACGKGECEIIATSTDNGEAFAVCTITVERSDIASGQLIINEIQSKNVDMFIDPSFNFGGWVEVYNPTDKAINIGEFYLSGNPDDLLEHHLAEDLGVVPAHGYKNIWFDHHDRYGKDHLQVNGKLDCDGGSVYLSDNEGNLIASAEYPEGIGRASWARTTDGGSEWGWTSTPSPEASNNGSTFCTEQAVAPVVDTNGKMFNSGENFFITIDYPKTSTLRYTTDGTTPTLENGETLSGRKIYVTKASIFRFRVFEEGKLPSAVVTRSYLVRDKNYTLPIASIVTDQKNITGSEYGVDVKGSGNGRSGNGERSNVNWNMDWDRPVSFEYIEQEPKANSEGYFQQEADLSISGGWSRKQTPRSFKIKASKVYDLNSLDYPFFEDHPYNKSKALLFRNGGNDGHAQERLKDGTINQIVARSGLYCDLQDYQPTHIFINGKYRGMQNMRQPSNKHLGYCLYGIDTDKIDAFEISVDSGYCQMSGTREAFDEWYELAKTAADPETWEKLCNLVDMDEYCNYMAVQLNLQNWDWPHNNHKGYRERREGGKFHMVLFDVDNVFEQNIGNPFTKHENDQTYTFYPIFEWNDKKLTLEVEPVTIFLNMLQNDTFRKKMIDTYCLVNGSVFEPNRCAEIIDEMAEWIKPAMSLEGYGNNVTNRANTMKNNFSESRQKNAVNYIKQYSRMKLSNVSIQNVELKSNIEEGKILLNDMYVPTGKFKGGLFSPITLKAEAPTGYKFVGWKSSSSLVNATTLIGKESNWDYYNEGSLDYTDWSSQGTEVDWNNGQAPFGYGNSGTYMGTNSVTKVGSSNDRKLCVYLRNTFELEEEPSADDTFRFNYVVDDGFRLHINGEDVGGYHSMEGDLYNDYTESHNSSWYEGSNPAEGTIVIPASKFHKGTNTIVLDLHNCNATSSDMFFDASLEYVSVTPMDEDYVSTDPVFQMPSEGDMELEAVFEEESDKDVLMASGNVPVKVNEVSAGNSVNVNDYFKKDDWFELYNNTDEDIDIAGMYVSDKAKNPLKYQIPADIEGLNTIIPARGHLVIWASKREIKGRDIHANFKLDNQDSALVILTAADKLWSDTLRYNAHGGQESYGRYPDGGQNVYHMTTPTIAKENVLSMYSDFAYTYIYSGVDEGADPETPTTIMDMAADVKSIEYINASGVLVRGSRESLRPGIYIVRYHMADGTITTRKQIIK